MANKLQQRLKAEHRIVFQALEVANIALDRVVTAKEVTATISRSDENSQKLKDAYDRNLGDTVAKILDQLRARSIIFSPGKIGARRYYGSVIALPPEKRSLPEETSRRQRVLKLVKGAVIELGRAVRTGDILKYAEHEPNSTDLTPADITHDVLSLKKTGELQVIASPVRKDEHGSYLYLPADFDPDLYKTLEPLTWLDEVAGAFKDLWDERAAQAVAADRLPRPLSTGEVRLKLLSAPQPHENLKNPQLIVNAMIQLSQTDAAVIRKVKRPGQKASLWAPCDVPDELLDVGDAYASDAERVGEAVRRAVIRLGRPVSQREVASEIKLDATLQPAGSSGLFSIISDAAKEHVDAGDGVRRERILRRVYYVGKVDGEAHYYHSADGLEDAGVFVRLRQIESRWSEARAEGQFYALAGCSLPSVAIGRAMLVAGDAREALTGLDRILEDKSGDAATRRDAEELHEQVCRILEGADEWLAAHAAERQSLPPEVSRAVPTWTAAELLPVLMPLYPHAQSITDTNQLIRLLHGEIRRIPNSEHTNRFSKDPRLAAEYLFDRTDALLYAAKKWGGRECCLQAMIASSQLGWLRDARFVFPALESKSYEARLAGVACLAFLQTDEGNRRLLRLAVEDDSPAVREAALWACGFAGVEGILGILNGLSERDLSTGILRGVAEAAIAQHETSWWAL
jgi:hypothetical protein